MQIVKRVRALSVWRESVLSAVQTARSVPALQPQHSPAHHPANTPTGKVGSNVDSSKCSTNVLLLCYTTTIMNISVTSGLIAVCQTTNRRVVVTQWTARLPQKLLAIATVPSQSDATSLTATRTVSPVLHVLPRRLSPASPQFVLLWCLQWGCRITTTTLSLKHLATQVNIYKRYDVLVKKHTFIVPYLLILLGYPLGVRPKDWNLCLDNQTNVSKSESL